MKKEFFNYIFVLVFISCLCSCSPSANVQITIDLSKYQIMRPRESDSVLFVTLLHAYKFHGSQNKEQCAPADLLVCRESDNRDSIFVLDLKELSGDDMFNKKKPESGLRPKPRIH